MSITTYNFALSSFPGSSVYEPKLHASLAGAIPSFLYVGVDYGASQAYLTFSAPLSVGDQTTMNSIVAAHNSVPYAAINLVAGGTDGTITNINGNSTANRTITFPDATTTLVGTDFSQTLTNKSLNNSTVFHVDNSDNTKKIGFSLNGATTSTTLTVAESQTTSQTISIPNITGADTLMTLGVAQTISSLKTFSTAPNMSSLTAGQAVVTDGSKNLASLSYTSAATLSTIMSRDANVNTTVNNLIEGYTTTATAGGTTTLTVSSQPTQYFTGTSNQTVVMPVTSTLVQGFKFWIMNKSTGSITVQSSGGNSIIVAASNQTVLLICILTTGTTAASWDYLTFNNFAGISTLNGLNAVSQTFATGTTGTDFNISSSTSTHTFNIPDASSTNRGLITTGSQTIAGSKTFTSAPSFSAIINTGTLTLPTSTDTLVGRATTDTLTNKTLNSTNVLFADGTDPTKKIGFSSGSANTATTLTIAESQTTSQTISIPNITGADTFMTLGLAQTVSGLKTFSTAPNMSSLTASQAVVTDASKNLASLSYTSNPNASSIVYRDVSANTTINNVITRFATTATANGTTTLTVTSEYQQYFTGTSNQTIVLPITTTLVQGQSFWIINASTGTLTIQSSGLNTVATIGQAQSVNVICVLASGTTAASWFPIVSNNNDGISVLNTLIATNQSFATATTGTDFNISSSGSTHTFSVPDASSTNRGLITTGSQTIAGSKTFTSAPSFSAIVNTGTLTLPTSTDTLIGRATTDTLTNKSLTNASVFFVDGTDNTKKIGFLSSGATTGMTLTVAETQTTSQTISIPNITGADTFMTLGLAQTVSALKTFSTAPNMSSLTASQAVVTDASKNLASLAYSSAAAGSTLVSRDANANTTMNNNLYNYSQIASSNGTTTLSVSSPYFTQITGTLSHTVVMPVTSTLVLGQMYFIINSSSGNITVNSSGSNLITTLTTGQAVLNICILTSGTTAASWQSVIFNPNGGVSSWSGGSTGFTPATSTTGAVTLAGTLAVTNGGTGVVSPAAGSLLIGNGASAMTQLADVATGSALTSGGVGVSPGWTAFTSNATASTLASRDTNANMRVNNLINNFAPIATAAGTTTLTVASQRIQQFTGTQTQTVVMPVTSTLVQGQMYTVINNSTGAITINSSGGNNIAILTQNQTCDLFCILTSGTTASSWYSKTSSSTSVLSFSGDTTGLTPTSATAGNVVLGGVLNIAHGGTNSSSTLNNNCIMVSNGGAIVESATLTNGQLLIGSTGAAPVVANITAGSGITITNSAGGITITNALGASHANFWATASVSVSTTIPMPFLNKDTSSTSDITIDSSNSVITVGTSGVYSIEYGVWNTINSANNYRIYTTGTGSSTIAAGSNGAVLPQATINVVSATTLPSSGTVSIVSSAGTQTITYTGKTTTTLTGCGGGTGTLSTGGAVVGLQIVSNSLISSTDTTSMSTIVFQRSVTANDSFRLLGSAVLTNSSPGGTGSVSAFINFLRIG